MELVLYILMFLSTAFAFIYGAIKSIGKKGALFKALVTYAFGCLMLGRLYETVTLLIEGTIPEVFNIGMLAVVGGFMFFFSASLGSMDGLVDDKGAKMAKYRIIALAAPAVIMSFTIPIWLDDSRITAKIITTVIMLYIALASYYGLKHLIIPDVSQGIIASIRGYSLLSLIMAFLYAVQLMSSRLESSVVWTVSSILLIVICLIIIPVLERESKKWTI